MNWYKTALIRESSSSPNTVYHVTRANFDSLGGNIGIGLHVASSLNGAGEFAEAHYGENFTILTIETSISSPLVMHDVGAFNDPANFLSQLVQKDIISEAEFKELTSIMGASNELDMYMAGDYMYTAESDRDRLKEDINDQDMSFLGLHGLDYSEWEPIRQFLASKGYDSLKYYNKSDAGEDCYVIFYDNQFVIKDRLFCKDMNSLWNNYKYKTPEDELLLEDEEELETATETKFERVDAGLGLETLYNGDIAMNGGMRSGSSPAGTTRVKYTVFDQVVLESTKDPDQSELGYIEIFKNDAGNIVGLVKVELNKDKRGGGNGRRVIETIINNSPQMPFPIFDIEPKAVGFWDSMGVTYVSQQNVLDLLDNKSKDIIPSKSKRYGIL